MPTTLYMILTNTRFMIGFAILLGVSLFGIIGPLMYQRDPFAIVGRRLAPPSKEFPLGTDVLGRDVLALLMVGVRTSLYVGLLTALFAVAIGISAAVLAVAFPGIVDDVIMAIINFFLSIPSTLLALIFAFYSPIRSFEVIAFIIALTGWPGFARSLRARLLSLKELDYIYLSRVSGLSTIRIVLEDMLPGLMPYILIGFASHVDDGILGEATLSLLGLQPQGTKVYSLGLMLQQAQGMGAIRMGVWWWFVPPGAITTLVLISLLLISTSLDEIFNPRLRKG
ncbi:MAG: ABC transporter permease [Ignisphaera sp.]